MLLFSLSIGSFLLQFFAGGIISPVANHVDPQAQQLAVADFIMKRLSPTDGAVGVFYLGAVSFALPEFEIADFLGKADEQIAQLNPKWGPPGHNKWNIELTLRKSNPARFQAQTEELKQRFDDL